MTQRSLVLALAVALFAALSVSPALSQPTSKPLPPEHSNAPKFLVGAAKRIANPAETVCLGGYGSFCTRPMQGIHDDLYTRALAISSRYADGDDFIFVTTTAVGLFVAYKESQGPNGIYDMRQAIAERTGIAASDIVIVSDHSHAAPDTIGIWGGVPRWYMDFLKAQVVDAAVEAFEQRTPAKLFVGSAVGPEVSSSYSQGPTIDPDNEFRALWAENDEGTIATFINYAPHATVLGSGNEEASGDWTAWAAEIAEARYGGTGVAGVGALGATDWESDERGPKNEAEARDRIGLLLDAARANRTQVQGSKVGVESVFINEPLEQPVLFASYLPGLNYGQGDLRIDRSVTPPWVDGAVIGTYGGAVRIGDVFMGIFPGEPFPQVQYELNETVAGAREHFLLGAANDFLGYMVADPQEQYPQVAREGALFLAGCPEDAFFEGAGVPHDGACPDHWTLMVSPTIGTHLICTAQDAASRLGFEVSGRKDMCDPLTATDGLNAPPETNS